MAAETALQLYQMAGRVLGPAAFPVSSAWFPAQVQARRLRDPAARPSPQPGGGSGRRHA